MKFTAFLFLFLTGCTVISYNRAFPKLDWVWSHDAKVQREEKRIEKEFQRTNHVSLTATNDPYVNVALVEKVRKRDGTNFLGVYMGMIAEWDGMTSRYHPPTNYIGGPTGLEFADKGWMETNAIPMGVMMFSATSGELLKWISAEDFTNIFVLKTQPEYPQKKP